MITQDCKTCKSTLPLDAFHKDKNLRNGRRYVCKLCANKVTRLRFNERDEKAGGLASTWEAMKQRCLDPNHDSYHRYGGRGVTICNEWRDSIFAFSEWALSNGYQPGLQLDRIENDIGYCPENCQFLTPKENTRKRPATKLTMAIADEIRAAVANGATQSSQAKRYKITTGHASLIVNRKLWV